MSFLNIISKEKVFKKKKKGLLILKLTIMYTKCIQALYFPPKNPIPKNNNIPKSQK